MRAGVALALTTATLVLAAGCDRAAPPQPQPAPQAPPDPMVHTIALPDIPPPQLPDAPGREMLVGACSTCHTPRYVLDQPPFPRRTWAAEVDKMRHTFGAPFPEEMSKPIVDYLVAVRGANG